jgi:quercetin dioxygenase-like cupin family protein
MSNYTVLEGEDAIDFMSDYPGFGQMLSYTHGLGAEQVAITLRRMPPGTGGKGSYGHRHKTQEELILVVDGVLQVKVDDDEFEMGAGTAIRLAPEALRSVHNDGPGEVTIVLCSVKLPEGADYEAETEQVPGFWPQDD